MLDISDGNLFNLIVDDNVYYIVVVALKFAFTLTLLIYFYLCR